MQRLGVVAALIMLPLMSVAQTCTVRGIVVDALTKEPLIGAYIKNGDAIMATDLDGRFSLSISGADNLIEASYIGYQAASKKVSCTGDAIELRFSMETLVMKEAVVAADIAIARKTPVAFTNVLPAQIQEELAGRDLPLVLNTTPGVYATQQGGGDGDARVTIRGFDQTNLAVMVDGVPMNDMENGWVYWSNWAGLDLVVRTVQVQRGLGASKLAIPSVGGTINILTGGDESANGSLNYQTEIGSYGYFRNSVSGVFGSREKGFLHVVGSYKSNQGYAEGLGSEAYAYYLKGRKTIGSHNLSVTTFGAPQRHGQRAYQMQVYEWDMGMAWDLASDEERLELQEIQDNLGDNAIFSRGRQFNEFLMSYNEVYYDLNEETQQRDTTYGASRRYNPRQNQYYKPIVTARDVWSISDKSTLTTTAYASFGSGGGEALNSVPGTRLPNGDINFQNQWDAHQLFLFNEPTLLNLDENGERPGSNFVRIAHNDHRWFGALTNFSSDVSEFLNVSAGLDGRHYTGSHYRTIGDLFGADYYDAPDDRRDQNADFDEPLRQGDRYYYSDDGQVAWGGTYAQLEWDKHGNVAFINVSGAKSWYRGIDYFRPRVVTLNDTTYEVNGKDEWSYLGQDDWSTDPLADGTILTADHPGLSTFTTDWIELNSATIKAGGKTSLNEWTDLYGNVGYLNRAPLFNSVLDLNNEIIEGYENQYVKAVELGVKFAKGKFASNINAYHTSWENKPINRFYSVANLWKDPTLSVYCDTTTTEGKQKLFDLAEIELDVENEIWSELELEGSVADAIENINRRLGYNLLNADAIHSGVEWDFAYEPNSMWDFQGVVSVGNWEWTSNERVDLVNSVNNDFVTRINDGAVADTVVNLNGVKVGDAAQRQISFLASFHPKRGSYISIRNTWFWRHYANFSPGDVITEGEPKEVWVTPSYALLDINAGTRIEVSENADLNLRFSLTNALDALYITDATNNSQYAPNPYGPEGGAGRAEVFLGPPRMIRLSAVLELKNLQQKKPKE